MGRYWEGGLECGDCDKPEDAVRSAKQTPKHSLDQYENVNKSDGAKATAQEKACVLRNNSSTRGFISVCTSKHEDQHAFILWDAHRWMARQSSRINLT
jgi:hypothetical protein